MARLDFVISTALSLSLRAARQKIAAGVTRVDGVPVTQPSWQLVLGAGIECITVDGEPVDTRRRPFHRLLLLHKPPNCLSVRPRKSSKPELVPTKTIFDLVPPSLLHRELGPFGRLDKDTTGLILLGTDGGLQTLITHPSSHITKKYIATLRPGFDLAPDAVQRIGAIDTAPNWPPRTADCLSALVIRWHSVHTTHFFFFFFFKKKKTQAV
eukprot:SAG11_NODE_1905_length_4085_cov_6.851480_2_plen_211_part_00